MLQTVQQTQVAAVAEVQVQILLVQAVQAL
jgi:hypothetical protein